MGRSADADLQLIDEKVSREHCVIEPAPGGHSLCDLGSKNGTYHNGAKLDGARVLSPGDQIGIGETVLVYEPSFETLLGSDGESTVILTGAAASLARSSPAPGARALERAGELAL